jgi:PAS domain-containing protein
MLFDWVVLEHTLVVVLLATVVVLVKKLADERYLSKIKTRCWNLSHDIHVCAGLDGLVKESNPSFERILGWKPEEYKKIPYIDMVHPDDRQRTIDHLVGMQKGEVRTVAVSYGVGLCSHVHFHSGWHRFEESSPLQRRLLQGGGVEFVAGHGHESEREHRARRHRCGAPH